MTTEHTQRSPTPLLRKSDGLSITEAAERIGVNAGTIRNWIDRGDLPVTRFGADRPGRRAVARIHPSDLELMRS